jgi:hypothetical protein
MSGLVEHQIAIDGFTHTNNTKENILRNPQICSKPKKKKRIVLSNITFQRSESQIKCPLHFHQIASHFDYFYILSFWIVYNLN